MQIFRWLLLVPTFCVGTLYGSVFLGMAPVMALGAFVRYYGANPGSVAARPPSGGLR